MKSENSSYCKIMLITLVGLIAFNSCAKTNRTKKDVLLEANLTVCELVDDLPLYDGKAVRVNGQLKGFHQLVLSSDECPGPVYLILTDLSYSDTAFSRDNVPPGKRPTNEISGNATVEGIVNAGGGSLINYGEFISDTRSNKVIQDVEDIKVSMLTDTKLMHFISDSD